MGLAVSQVRLLALTNRKADIECQMQIDSKRKMMLTRKSTELAQQYYSKLQCANIQYATSNGYEDVDFSYLMGQTVSNKYTAGFLDQVAYGNSREIPQKTQNKMILTNQFGEVVVNDTIAKLVAEVKNDFSSEDITTQTAQAILRMISDVHEEGTINTNSFTGMYNLFHDYISHIDETGACGTVGRENLVKYLGAILDNGGFKDGGVIYQPDGSGPYFSDKDCAVVIVPDSGTCYRVEDPNKHFSAVTDSVLFYGDTGSNVQPTNLKVKMATYLGNLCSYFGPMISAAIQNGTSTKVEAVPRSGAYMYDKEHKTVSTGSGSITFADADVADLESIKNKLKNSSSTFSSAHTYLQVADADGYYHYFDVVKNPSGTVTVNVLEKEDISNKFYEEYKIKDDTNFLAAMNKEKLQSGFRSGLFQLAMVDDIGKGNYHKNTTLEYFTHMNYVVEKTDSSKREEITAWFNAENAAISEKETYWDTEIQNLSTELNSVTTEIDSVKQLKSNAIKSVFNWGGN